MSSHRSERRRSNHTRAQRSPGCRAESLESRRLLAGDGLSAIYYDNANFTGVNVSRIDPAVNFTWNTAAPATGIGADTYSVRWSGEVQAIETGAYTFRTTTDDGVRLWVDDQLIINKWQNQGPTPWTGTIQLLAGQRYHILLEYYENTGGASATLEWQRPGQASFAVVPQAQLYSRRFDLPSGTLVKNVKDFGAVGDGIADDTAAIQSAINAALNAGSRYAAPNMVYLPNGTYKVSNTLASRIGTGGFSDGWRAGLILYGQSRDGVTIRLADNLAAYNGTTPKAVIVTGSEGRSTNATGGGNQAFRHSIINLTVDTGVGNTKAIGIDYLTNNRGAIENVTVRSSDGQGFAGIAMDRDWPGPGMIQTVLVDGFDYGVRMAGHYQYSMTFEHLTIQNQRVAGMMTDNNAMFIRDLVSRNSVPVIDADGDQNGMVTVIDGEFTGGAAGATAITSRQRLLVRNIRSSGYGTVINNQVGTNADVAGGAGVTTVAEFSSHTPKSLFTQPSLTTLNLPVKETPAYHTNDMSQWANVATYGATRNNSADDDAAAIQAAIDSGKEIIYLPNGDYHIGSNVIIRGNVKKIVGFQSSIGIKGGTTPILRVDGVSGDTVILEHLWIDAAISHNTSDALAIKHADINGGVSNTASGTGDLFIEDVIKSPININFPQKVWIRQWNPEFDPNPFMRNNGGDVWALGIKTESGATMSTVIENIGGKVEVLGAMIYPLQKPAASVPMFINDGGSMTLSWLDAGGGNYYPTAVRERQNGEWRTYSPTAGESRGWPLFVGRSLTTGPAQGPYGGTARTISNSGTSKIEAEDFDTGGQGVAYNDTDTANQGGGYRTEGVDLQTTSDTGGGFNVGWTADGEWLEYTVNVQAGTYDVGLRVASTMSGKQVRVLLDGVQLGVVTVPNTGNWQAYQTVTLPGVSLAAGNNRVLRVEFVGGSANLNYIAFAPVGALVPAAPSALGSSAASSSQINLSWTDNSANESGFRIERKTGSGGTWAEIGTVGAGVTTFQNTDLSASTQYFYRVRAYNTAGNSAYSNEASATTPVAPTGGIVTTTGNYSYGWSAYSGTRDVNATYTGNGPLVWTSGTSRGLTADGDGARSFTVLYQFSTPAGSTFDAASVKTNISWYQGSTHSIVGEYSVDGGATWLNMFTFNTQASVTYNSNLTAISAKSNVLVRYTYTAGSNAYRDHGRLFRADSATDQGFIFSATVT